MQELWPRIATRAVQGLDVQAREVILVRDGAGRYAVLQEMLLAVERVGATPLPEIVPAEYRQRLLTSVDPVHLSRWDQHRQRWMQQVDRVLVLGGGSFTGTDVPPNAVAAWTQAIHRLTRAEEDRHLPVLVVAVPTETRARQLGMPLDVLQALVCPALAAPVRELQREISRVLAAVQEQHVVTIQSGTDCVLSLTLADRPWLADDGVITMDDRGRGAVVSNLPAGSVYTTVSESATQGTLWLPQAEQATDVVLHFADGRIVDVTAAQGRDSLLALFDRHTGEARRVAHIGIGLNPYLHQLVGWTLIDEHVYGALFLALGENRYMGGRNASSLNVDYAIPGATLRVDGRLIVAQGQVMVSQRTPRWPADS